MTYLAAMLHATVTPLEDRQPTNTGRYTGRSGNPNPGHKAASDAHHTYAMSRYKSVMGDEWVPTVAIESRLGTCPSGVTGTLLSWLDKGIVERRKVGPEKSWNRRKGHEWRFVK